MRYAFRAQGHVYPVEARVRKPKPCVLPGILSHLVI